MSDQQGALGRADIQLGLADFDLDVGFDIPAHGVLGVFGPSGCGKTSLLRCLAGLETRASGHIRLNGDTWLDTAGNIRVPACARAIGYVFQEGRLFPHLEVARNLDYGARRRGARESVTTRDEVIELLDIGPLLERKPAQLSGGEQQRVSIGRALLSAPRLLLMDEPLANLDRQRKQEILPYLDRLHAELKVPIIYVSHSINEVSRLCDQLLLLRQGRVMASGPMEDVFGDIDLAVDFGDMAGVVLPVRSEGWNPAAGVTSLMLEHTELRIPEELPAGDMRLRVRADDVSIVLEKPRGSSILNIIPAAVQELRDMPGGMAMVQMQVAGHSLLARVSQVSLRQLQLVPGMAVHAQIKGAAIRR
ncbi:MAG: molybdenum ABC transporter ATP-binding protein [Gammaproteobacteria bacterium]|nr:molybdenum ABC transporter ATP-binding protein [Gammaproteobacteria bacterium]